jgi:hypothetical protein
LVLVVGGIYAKQTQTRTRNTRDKKQEGERERQEQRATNNKEQRAYERKYSGVGVGGGVRGSKAGWE